jgi:predicted nucleic-acid-binding Zn-ribbon protein
LSQYKCGNCGNKRFFYNEVSVMAKELLDQKQGPRNGKIIEIESNRTDNFFEIVYCYKCGEVVEE